MGRYRVTLRYRDGTVKVVERNGSSPSDVRSYMAKMAKQQANDPRWGGDRSSGKPRIVSIKEA